MAGTAFVKDNDHIVKVDQVVACHRVSQTMILVQLTNAGTVCSVTFTFSDAAKAQAFWAQLAAAMV